MRLLAKLDPWLLRTPFEGGRARRYTRGNRVGFGDLDDRLLDRWWPSLTRARTVVDVGAGPGALAARLAARARAAGHDLRVIGVEPSAAFDPAPDSSRIRARAEALPMADAAADAAIMLSVIRHVADRRAALRELRRVVRPGGVAWIVELDPQAPRARIRRHTAPMPSALARATFAPLVLRTAPTGAAIAALACEAGWRRAVLRADSIQPVYELCLSDDRNP